MSSKKRFIEWCNINENLHKIKSYHILYIISATTKKRVLIFFFIQEKSIINIIRVLQKGEEKNFIYMILDLGLLGP